MPARLRRQRGFTLLEILVAFVVLALVGGALLQLFQGGLRNLTSGEGYSRAALLADSTLSRLRAEAVLDPGTRRGELEPGYRYSLTLSPYQEDGLAQDGLLQADLEIAWGDVDAPHSYRLRTLLLPPGTKGGG